MRFRAEGPALLVWKARWMLRFLRHRKSSISLHFLATSSLASSTSYLPEFAGHNFKILYGVRTSSPLYPSISHTCMSSIGSPFQLHSAFFICAHSCSSQNLFYFCNLFSKEKADPKTRKASPHPVISLGHQKVLFGGRARRILKNLPLITLLLHLRKYGDIVNGGW